MIYTVTINPSLDYIVTVNDFKLGQTNRTGGEQILPGGKGINVSIVLHNLGIETTALGFSAGFTGRKIMEEIAGYGIPYDFIPVENGFSRINLKLKNMDGTEINGQGPVLSDHDVEKLLRKLDGLKAGDILVLAGSIPGNMSNTTYKRIMERLCGKGILFVVDATGELLLNALENGPFLIKPNIHELGESFHEVLDSEDKVITCAGKLQDMGAENVLISMAGAGALLLDANGRVHKAPTPKGQLINAVGAGDSMVAGFLAGWIKEKDYEHALRMGLAAGSASAFSELLATKEEVTKLYEQTFKEA